MPENSKQEKGRISITIDNKLLEWLNDQVKSKRFGTKSHGIEVALNVLKKKVETGEKIEFD